MTPPEGLTVQENTVCKLVKSLYGLKQSPRCWNAKFDNVLQKYGLTNSHADRCVYIGCINNKKIYLLLYVDDGLLLSTDVSALTQVMNDLKKEFSIKICKSSLFIGMQIEKCDDYIFVHQRTYIEALIRRFNMCDANTNSIPADPHVILEKSTVPDRNNKHIPYREAVGSLMFTAIVSRPDIMYAVCTAARYLNNYDQTHWNAVKRIIKYLKETKHFGLCFRSKQSSILECYSDADYANDPDTRRSTTGYVFMRNGAAVTWSSQRQTTVALSTTEAEFMATCWAHNLFN
uniref:Reverse transcriptase Ty1/copia-type domain-containing protein n=1 Tax=Heliothis virescens TaxID=7102 RepID=A0A2A4JNV5_HELVI